MRHIVEVGFRKFDRFFARSSKCKYHQFLCFLKYTYHLKFVGNHVLTTLRLLILYCLKFSLHHAWKINYPSGLITTFPAFTLTSEFQFAHPPWMPHYSSSLKMCPTGVTVDVRYAPSDVAANFLIGVIVDSSPIKSVAEICELSTFQSEFR